jgi:hypothetical protein
MENNDYYKNGKGMFGGPKGTYGRYGISPMANNLSRQFEKAEAVEETQRRRFKRKRESGFVGNGYWFGLYPYMVGAMSSGTDPRDGNTKDHDQPMSDSATAASSDGLGMGGVTFNGSDGGVS